MHIKLLHNEKNVKQQKHKKCVKLIKKNLWKNLLCNSKFL